MQDLRDRILIALSVKGFADADALAPSVEVSAAEVAMIFDVLMSEGLAKTKLLGTKLTAKGIAEARKAWMAEQALVDGGVRPALLREFEPIDSRLKGLVSDWNMKKTPSGPMRNHHDNVAYDTEITDSIASVHDAITPLLAMLSGILPRFVSYTRRLEEALQKVIAGDGRFVAEPLLDSYNTVWIELREDLTRLSQKNG
ncbi:MAG: hypothetical protein ACFBZ9_06810 [Sphingomonadales bacterium]